MSEARQRFLKDPYHKDRFTYDGHSDSFTCPQGQTLEFVRIQHANRVPLRLYRASGAVCQAPSLQGLYQGQGDWAKSGHRAARRSATSPSRLDVHRSSQRGLRAEKAAGRAGLRNHQGATGSTEIPAAWPRQRGGRVDRIGHRFQPAHPVAGLALPLLHPATPRAESPSHFLIPTGPAITLRQSIATFNSPGKGCSTNPTGLIQLLLPPTLYITFGTGSTANFSLGGPAVRSPVWWTRLSCHRFVANQVRLALFILVPSPDDIGISLISGLNSEPSPGEVVSEYDSKQV